MTDGTSSGSRSSQADGRVPATSRTAKPKRLWFSFEANTAIAFSCYAILLLWLTWKHTYWRDESEVWLVARASSTVPELLRNVRYEGHPPLWYFVLYGITRYTADVEWMKFPNLIVSLVAAGLILTARHLRLWVRLGIVFSYYIVFEYGTIARNYMIGIMFLVAAVRFMDSRRKTSLYVSILLSLAALTSLPALIVSAFLGSLYLWILWRAMPQRTVGSYFRSLGVGGILGILVYCACALVAAAMIRPPADSGLLLDSQFASPGLLHKITQCGQLAIKAYVPVPQWQPKFWNTILLDTLKSHVESFLGLLLILLLIFFFKKKPVRCFFAAASGIEFAQMVFSGRAFQRHMGWLFIIFMLGLLLDSSSMMTSTQSEDGSRLVVRDRWRTTLLATILFAQVAASFVAVYFSSRFEFSAGKQVALYLRTEHLDQVPLAFEPYYASQSILAYLPDSSGYDLEQHEQVKFLVWNRREFLERRVVPSIEDLQAATRNGEAPVLITERRLGAGDAASLHLNLLASFEDAICPQDRYYIYR